MARNGNKWISNNILRIIVIITGLVAIGAVMHEAVTKDIPALYLADKEQCEAIDANENAIIKIEGKIETLRVEQQSYHKDSSEKLDKIWRAVDK